MPLSSEIDSDRLSDDELIFEAWRRGRLRWLLRPHQIEMYDHYREWELQDPSASAGQFGRIYVMDVARRVGKTSLRFLIRCEDCIRNPGRSYRYVTAFQKDIEEIVDDVARVMLDTCPDSLRPEFRLSKGAQPTGFYFPNGSVLKLAGLDKNPNALRGRASDGDDLSEAVFISHLTSSVKNVLYAQYQGRPWARMCLESSAPEGPDTEYDKVFVADAKIRAAYVWATIDDNTSLSDAERAEFIRAAGGRGHPDCEREYYNERTRDPERVLVPEFDPARHVRLIETPKYADCYTFCDPGIDDMLALVFAYWHFEMQKLVVVDSWAEYNAGTHKVADITREYESDLFGTVTSWNGKELRAAPHLRISDTDKRFVHDMQTEFGLAFDIASKSDLIVDGRHESTLQLLRTWFRDDRIIVHPDAGPVLDHLVHGKWNQRRTDWDRHPSYGHFDCVAALKYGPRHIERNRNPNPPEWFIDPNKVRLTHLEGGKHRGTAQLPPKTIEGLRRMFPKPSWKQ